jgi:hypothetical protein
MLWLAAHALYKNPGQEIEADEKPGDDGWGECGFVVAVGEQVE